MRFEFFLAARYLRAKRRQAVVGVVTAISVAGVAAGVAALIIALAITNGMQRDLQDRLLGSSSHVELMRVEADGIRDWRPLLDRLRQLPHVTAAAPGIYEEVMVSHGPRAGFALVKGIIPTQERTVSNLLGTLTSGSAAGLEPSVSDSSGTPALVLGSDLAEQIGVQVGDQVVVTSPPTIQAGPLRGLPMRSASSTSPTCSLSSASRWTIWTAPRRSAAKSNRQPARAL
jgi:lipoprotein-releasing system permease protein